nr:5091_t:CDS:2 [Entrophospora candida]
MEFPDLGKQCANPDCKQLDYLPIKCHFCKIDYCKNHYKPKHHHCKNAPDEDGVKVPTCPICSSPIPISKGEDPNIRIRLKSTSTKPFNSCSVNKCKNRIAVKIVCSGCNKSYCIKHRLEIDHTCNNNNKNDKIFRKIMNSNNNNRINRFVEFVK